MYVCLTNMNEDAKMNKEKFGPGILHQLLEVAQKYWGDEARKSAVISKILKGLKVPTNCSALGEPMLNEEVPTNKEPCSSVRERLNGCQTN